MVICAFKLNHDDGDIANNDVCAKQAMETQNLAISSMVHPILEY